MAYTSTRERCFGATIFFMACIWFITAINFAGIPFSSHHIYTRINPSILNLTTSRSQLYQLTGDIRIPANSSTIHMAHLVGNWTATPYARLPDRTAMAKSKKIEIVRLLHSTQPCRKFNVPAIVFSTGGYSGNLFHDFTDILVPLYATSRRFNRSVVFLVSDKRRWWTFKYQAILDALSNHDPIDIDNGHEPLCFSRVIVGLKAGKGELGIDPSPPPSYSIREFREFLRSTYSLGRREVSRDHPRLLLVSRRKTRHLTNEAQVADVARGLGFDVDVRELGGRVSSVAKLVNGFDVMVGIHGAGLTNMVFLPENGVVVEIVPVGLETMARAYFERPAREMRMRYLDYKVSMNESTLVGKYRYQEKGWHAFRSVYLDGQDVSVDLGRFIETLLKALEHFQLNISRLQ